MTTFSVSEDSQVTQRALMNGLMPKLLEILLSGPRDDRKSALFTLSNIAGSTYKEHIHALINDDQGLLIDRVIELTHHSF